MGAIQPRHLPRPCILPGWWHTTIVSQFGGKHVADAGVYGDRAPRPAGGARIPARSLANLPDPHAVLLQLAERVASSA